MFYPSSNEDACKEFKPPDFDKDPLSSVDENSGPERQPVLLIAKGGCNHAVKSANAEQFGFRASFIEADYGQFLRIQTGLDHDEKKGPTELKLAEKRTIPEFTIDVKDT